MARHALSPDPLAAVTARLRLEYELAHRHHYAVLRGLAAPSPWVRPDPLVSRHHPDAVLPPF